MDKQDLIEFYKKLIYLVGDKKNNVIDIKKEKSKLKGILKSPNTGDIIQYKLLEQPENASKQADTSFFDLKAVSKENHLIVLGSRANDVASNEQVQEFITKYGEDQKHLFTNGEEKYIDTYRRVDKLFNAKMKRRKFNNLQYADKTNFAGLIFDDDNQIISTKITSFSKNNKNPEINTYEQNTYEAVNNLKDKIQNVVSVEFESSAEGNRKMINNFSLNSIPNDTELVDLMKQGKINLRIRQDKYHKRNNELSVYYENRLDVYSIQQISCDRRQAETYIENGLVDEVAEQFADKTIEVSEYQKQLKNNKERD